MSQSAPPPSFPPSDAGDRWRRLVRGAAGASQVVRPPLAVDWMDQSDCGVLACDAQGRILVASEVAGRLLGMPAAALAGRSLLAWLADSALARPELLMAPGQRDLMLLKPGGVRWRAGLTVGEVQSPDPVRRMIVLRALSGEAAPPVVEGPRKDPLTGLPDRQAFRDSLTRAMARARTSQVPLALMFLDLDNFKRVNDSLGHAAGDALLRHVAGTLQAGLRGGVEPATVARIGGDEFTVIVPGVGSDDDAAVVAQGILDALEPPFRFGDTELQVSASIGITIYTGEAVDLDTLVRHTDMAMYRSKLRGSGHYTFFSAEMGAEAEARVRLESDLRRALERGEFALHYQPKVDLATGRITGVEALLRWHCPGRGLVPPDRFIPVLEDSRLILPVGAWVLRTACADLAAWDRAGLPPLQMAVNLSARQFAQPYLARFVEDTLLEHDVAPRRLELELTESLLLEDRQATNDVLRALAQLGVRVAMDDFGTGHSSLSRLKRLDIGTLKIDRSFVAELPHGTEDLAIVAAIVAMGRSLQMKVVAEGVETEAQADCLARLGCAEAQGYLISRPLAADQFVDWLSKRRAPPPREEKFEDTSPLTLISLEILSEE